MAATSIVADVNESVLSLLCAQGKGLSPKDRDNRVAKDIAGDVALADLLELGRLDGQLQDLLVWMGRSYGSEDALQEQSPKHGLGAKG